MLLELCCCYCRTDVIEELARLNESGGIVLSIQGTWFNIDHFLIATNATEMRSHVRFAQKK